MKQVGSNAVSLGIAIGDVSGKGISAALLMASLRASLRGLTRRSDGNLAGMMHEVNELVYEASANNRYATFFFAQLDPISRKLTYVNAGHNAPALIRHRENRVGEPEIIRLEAGGPVIGLLENSYYEQSTLVLAARRHPARLHRRHQRSHDRRRRGMERRLLDRAAGRSPDMPAAALVKCLFDAADEFAAGAPQHDDMTLLVLKMLVGPPSLPAST